MEEFFSRLETIGKAWHKAYDQKIYCTDDAIIGQMLQTINHDITRRSSRSLLHWKILKQNCFRDFLMDVIFYLVLSDFIYQR